MSASSQSRKVAEQMKAKKVERRHALEERQKPKNDKQSSHRYAPMIEVDDAYVKPGHVQD